MRAERMEYERLRAKFESDTTKREAEAYAEEAFPQDDP